MKNYKNNIEFNSIIKQKSEYDRLITIVMIVLGIILFTAFQLSAQNKKQKINDRHNKTITTQSATIPNAPQATGDKVTIKDGSTILMEIENEGSAGSIKLNDAGAVTPSANKLYNNGGNLYWNGSSLGGGSGADSLNDLGDVTFDGARSLFLGKNSGINDDGGNDNTALGIESLNANTSGRENVALGYAALNKNTVGKRNSAVGFTSLHNNTTGDFNSAFGFFSLYSNTDGNYNTATGNEALKNNTTGSNNTANGNYTLNQNTTGEHNTAIGHNALTSNISGDNNTAIGSSSLSLNTTGYSNTANGKDALQSNTTGFANTANGSSSLYSNTTGYTNTANGSSSLRNNTTGYDNTANGFAALHSNTTGSNNVALGYYAQYMNTIGDYNVAIGPWANFLNKEGSKNTIIGFHAGSNYGAASNNISGNVFLGYKAGYYETSDNKLYIQNDSSTSPLIWGDFANDSLKINGEFHVTNNTILNGKLGVGTMNPSDKVEIVADAGQDAFRVKVGTATKLRVFSNGGTSIGSNNLGTPANGLYVSGNIENQGGVLHTSDRRFKKNISTITNALERIKKINGVYYNWKTEEYKERGFTKEKQIGVIAQDVEKQFPELVNTDNEGYKSVNYSKLTPILIEAVKEQEASIKYQDLRIKTLEKRIKTLEEENKKLRQFVKNTSLENKVELLEQALNKLIKEQTQIKVSSK